MSFVGAPQILFPIIRPWLCACISFIDVVKTNDVPERNTNWLADAQYPIQGSTELNRMNMSDCDIFIVVNFRMRAHLQKWWSTVKSNPQFLSIKSIAFARCTEWNRRGQLFRTPSVTYTGHMPKYTYCEDNWNLLMGAHTKTKNILIFNLHSNEEKNRIFVNIMNVCDKWAWEGKKRKIAPKT